MIKQNLLAACVAATMATSTFADVSISGKYEGKLKNTSGASSYSQKLDLKLLGTSGNSKAVVSFDIDSGSASPEIKIGESYVSSKIGALSTKIGYSKGLTGNGLTFKKSSAANKISLGGKVMGVGVKATQKSGDALVKIDISSKFSGVAFKIQDVTRSTRTISANGDFSGVGFKLENSDSTTAFSLGTKVGGIDLSFVSIDAVSGLKNIQNDGIFGNIAGPVDSLTNKSTTTTKASGIVASLGTDFGKLTGKHFTVKHGAASSTTNKLSIKRGNVSYSFANVDNGTSSDNVIGAKISFGF